MADFKEIKDRVDTVIADLVNHPPHYNAYSLENLETIKGSMSNLEYRGFLKGNVQKYLYRYLLKGTPIQDIGKAIFYAELLKKEMEEIENGKQI